MKVEVGSFTPNILGNTVVLNDATLQVLGIWFQVCKTGSDVNSGTGFDDGTTCKSQWALDSTNKDSGQSSSYSMYAKKYSGSVQDAVRGKVDGAKFTNAGEFEVSFATVTSGYSVQFMAIGT